MDPGKAKPSWRSGNTHGFCVTGGLSPIASEPTPSPRLWATPPGATPARLCEHYHEGPHLTLETGTFYLAGNRNFLFGSDRVQASPLSVCPSIRKAVGLPCQRRRRYVQPWRDAALRIWRVVRRCRLVRRAYSPKGKPRTIAQSPAISTSGGIDFIGLSLDDIAPAARRAILFRTPLRYTDSTPCDSPQAISWVPMTSSS